MRNFGHFAVMAVAMVLVLSLVGNLALAGPSTTASTAAHHQYGKTPVCHATGSAKNPYVFLKVSQNSAHSSKHPDDLFGPAIDSKDDCPDGDGKKGKDEGKAQTKGKGQGKDKGKGQTKGKDKGKDKGKGQTKGKGKDKGKDKGKGQTKGKGKDRSR